MAIRSILLSAVLGMAAGMSAGVRDYPLDERVVYTVRIGTDEPTTCVFPGAIGALEAANLSAKAEDTPPVLLSHSAGTNYFSVRALRPGATAAANVLLGGRVYALRFVTGENPNRTVTFRTSVPSGSTEAWRALLGRARNLGHASTHFPELEQTVERALPGNSTAYRSFRATVEAVFRFDAEDTLVFRVRLENPGSGAVTYDPEGLAVRVGREVYPSVFAEASGTIPARGSAFAWFVVAGSPEGGRADLSPNLPFNVIVPHSP